MEYGIISLIIPLLTIILAIITKNVMVSLLGGSFAGLLVIHHYNPIEAFLALFDGIIGLFAQGWIVKTVIFMLLIGSIIQILNRSSAVDSFIAFLDTKAKRIDSPKGAMFLAYSVGILIFIESSITVLVAGTVAKPLCDKNGVSREKLAYICDATSAPVCSLIPINAWGALLLGLIVTQIDANIIDGDAVSLLIHSIPYNLYAIITLILVFFTIVSNKEIGSMTKAKAIPFIPSTHSTILATPYPMLLPISLMVILVPIGLYFTGDGDIFKGSGSTAIYYSSIITLFFIYGYFVIFNKTLSDKNYFEGFYEGLNHMMPISIIIIFALFIGKVIGELDTASYLTHILQGNIASTLIPLLIFWVASITAFSTGTSWGTFSIMMPIALTLASSLHLDIPLVIGAVISGGIFGDHASPISDTTILSSMAADCDHIEHVKTQLPYALMGAFLASIGFLIAGFITS